MMTATPNKTRKPASPSVAEDPRWARIIARDKTADGQLWYSVFTTGVYCRPSCPSRIPNPRNVQLYDSLESAKATGFRPCRRCNPDGASIDAQNAALVAKACRIIEQNEEEPSLEELAEAIGRSPSYCGGTSEEIRFAVGQTSLGAILVASSKKGVAAILLGDDPDELVRNLQDRFPKAQIASTRR